MCDDGISSFKNLSNSHFRQYTNKLLMAEAFVAAGLASSIITFIDASVKLAGVYKQFYNTCGQLPSDLAVCQRNADELSQRVTEIQRSLQAHPQALPSSETDDELQRVIVDCTAVCKRFQELMCSLVPSTPVLTAGTKSSSAAARSTLRVLRHHGEIKELQSKLEELKNNLRCCMAERMMKFSEVVCKQNRQMIESGKEFVQVHNANHSDLLDYLAEHQKRIQSVSTEVGCLKFDIRSINEKTDHVLVLVQDLVAINNSARGDSITIRIEIPSRLIRPVLGIIRMARNLPQQVCNSQAWLPLMGNTSPLHPRRKARENRSLNKGQFVRTREQFEMTTGDMQLTEFLTLAIRSTCFSAALVRIDTARIKTDKDFFQAIRGSITSLRSQQPMFLRPFKVSFEMFELPPNTAVIGPGITTGQFWGYENLPLYLPKYPAGLPEQSHHTIKIVWDTLGKLLLPENRHHAINITFDINNQRVLQILLLKLPGFIVLTVVLVIYGGITTQNSCAVGVYWVIVSALAFSAYAIRLGLEVET